MIAEWITAGANLAVLAGLILVAIQIRQNTAGIRGTAYQTWVSSVTDFNVNLAGNSELAGIVYRGHFNPEELDEQSAIQYFMAMLGLMHVAQSTYYLYRDGSIDRSLWEAELQRVAAHLSFPGVRQWWDAGAKTQLSPEFVEAAESTVLTATTIDWKPGVGWVPFESES